MFMYQVEEVIKVIINKVHTIWHSNLFPIAGNQIAVNNVVILIILLLLGLKYSKNFSNIINNYLIKKLEGNNHTASNMGMLIIYTTRVLYIIIAMAIANIPIGSLAFIGGAFAFGLGFGTQTLITNFVSGIIIMIEQPVKIGDIIEIKGIIGKVRSIGIRCVIIQTPANHAVLIPSSEIIQNNVTNWTLSNNIIKYQLEVIIPRTANISNCENLIEQIRSIIQRLDFIISSTNVLVFLTKVDATNLTFFIKFDIDIKQNSDREYIQNAINIVLYSHLQDYNCTLNHLEYAKI